jgi:hypothetical protein
MNCVNRRDFLRASGVLLALPALECLGGVAAGSPRRRMVCANTSLGLYAGNLFPAEAGRDYPLTPYLEVLRELRDDFTVFSGVSHPEVDGGHSSEASYLTAAPHPGSSSFRNTISLDQFAIERLAPDTRFPYLALGTQRGSLSVSRAGVRIPSEMSPAALFKQLFVDGSAKEVELQVQRLKDGQSIMDTVRDQAARLQKSASRIDRERLDQYFAAVREVEQRLVQSEAWAHRPKPRVDVPAPTDIADRKDLIGRTRLMFQVMHLALQTDSTRFITLSIDGMNDVPPIKGVTIDHHNLSHHGKDPEKLKQLAIIETLEMEALGEFLTRLHDTSEDGGSLLDHTLVLYGSNLGNASSHDTKNMPILLAGGGFRHGQHLAFDQKDNTPVARIFVSMLQRLGIETDTFASGHGRISGLELL